VSEFEKLVELLAMTRLDEKYPEAGFAVRERDIERVEVWIVSGKDYISFAM
jgi:hypothetical protein